MKRSVFGLVLVLVMCGTSFGENKNKQFYEQSVEFQEDVQGLVIDLYETQAALNNHSEIQDLDTIGSVLTRYSSSTMALQHVLFMSVRPDGCNDNCQIELNGKCKLSMMDYLKLMKIDKKYLKKAKKFIKTKIGKRFYMKCDKQINRGLKKYQTMIDTIMH